jgi:putative transposase
MRDYKAGSHAVWNCKYHLVWITKYRYPVLVGDVGQRARDLLREISRSLEMTIYAGAIRKKCIEDQKPEYPDDNFRVG